MLDKNPIEQVYLFVLANDEGANEDIDGEDDDADGDNEDGEGVHSKALGGVEHVGTGRECYVPFAEKRIIMAILMIIFIPNSIIFIIGNLHHHGIHSPPLWCTGGGEAGKRWGVGRVLGRLAVL